MALCPHPEGGWFAEVYRSPEIIDEAALAPRYGAARCLSTSIYFLLESGQCSTLHRLASDETWHFYDGSPLTIHMIDARGRYSTAHLGPDHAMGERFQITIPHDTWFGATVDDEASHTLIGCTVAPGFEYDDFEPGNRDRLCKLHPAHRDIIIRLTHAADWAHPEPA